MLALLTIASLSVPAHALSVCAGACAQVSDGEATVQVCLGNVQVGVSVSGTFQSCRDPVLQCHANATSLPGTGCWINPLPAQD